MRAEPDGTGTIRRESSDSPAGWCAATPKAERGNGPTPRFVGARAAASATAASSNPLTGGKTVIDVLVLYTQKLLDVEPAIPAYAIHLVQHANMVLRNSDVDIILRLVPCPGRTNPRDPSCSGFGAGEVVTFDVDEISDDDEDIEELDRRVNALMALRYAHNADLVNVLTWNERFPKLTGVCGIASRLWTTDTTLPEMAQESHSITNMVCEKFIPGFSKATFVHELGHTMGLWHGEEVDGTLHPRAAANVFHGSAGTAAYPQVSHDENGALPAWTEVLPGERHAAVATTMSYVKKSEPRYYQPYFSGDQELTHIGDPRFYLKGCTRADGHPTKSRKPECIARWSLGTARADSHADANARSHLNRYAADLASLSDYQWVLSRRPEDLAVEKSWDTSEGRIGFNLSWRDNSEDEVSFRVQGWVYERCSRCKQSDIKGYLPLRDFSSFDPVTGLFGAGTGPMTGTVEYFDPGDLAAVGFRVAAVNRDGPTWSDEVVHYGPFSLLPPRPAMPAFDDTAGKMTFTFTDVVNETPVSTKFRVAAAGQPAESSDTKLDMPLQAWILADHYSQMEEHGKYLLSAVSNRDGATYRWSHDRNETGAVVAARRQGKPKTYTVTVTHNGETASASYLVAGSRDPLAVSIGGPRLIDKEQFDPTRLVCRVSGGTPPYRVVWDGAKWDRNSIEVKPERDTAYRCAARDSRRDQWVESEEHVLEAHLPQYETVYSPDTRYEAWYEVDAGDGRPITESDRLSFISDAATVAAHRAQPEVPPSADKMIFPVSPFDMPAAPRYDSSANSEIEVTGLDDSGPRLITVNFMDRTDLPHKERVPWHDFHQERWRTRWYVAEKGGDPEWCVPRRDDQWEKGDARDYLFRTCTNEYDPDVLYEVGFIVDHEIRPPLLLDTGGTDPGAMVSTYSESVTIDPSQSPPDPPGADTYPPPAAPDPPQLDWDTMTFVVDHTARTDFYIGEGQQTDVLIEGPGGPNDRCGGSANSRFTYCAFRPDTTYSTWFSVIIAEPYTVMISEKTTFSTGKAPANAPAVSIGAVPAGEESTEASLTATLTGGVYDALSYAWTASAGSLNDATLESPTWTRPTVDADGATVTIGVTVTASGSGTQARSGTTDTASASVSASVTDAAKPVVLPAPTMPTFERVIPAGGPPAITCDDGEEFGCSGYMTFDSAAAVKATLPGADSVTVHLHLEGQGADSPYDVTGNTVKTTYERSGYRATEYTAWFSYTPTVNGVAGDPKTSAKLTFKTPIDR
ncbi:MAG: hypothetical protein OXH70_21815 [Acidobacteria bacterium]|nr:hypothetical protein [Acidobacteriota bacterium]